MAASQQLTSTQIGAIAESLVANAIMVHSKGRLSPFVPLADDDGIDLLVYDKRTGRAVSLQIKARTVTLFKPGTPSSITVRVLAPEGGNQVLFVRGDVDAEGTFNALVDSLFLLEFGFLAGPPPPCDGAADADDNGEMNTLVDALYILTYGFLHGAAPPAPFPDCGPDPTNDPIGCENHPACP